MKQLKSKSSKTTTVTLDPDNLFELYRKSLRDYAKQRKTVERDPMTDPDGKLDFGGERGEGW